MRKYWRYIIPFLIFVILVVGFLVDPLIREAKIKRMLNEAGRNGEPVVVVYEVKGDNSRVALYDIRGQAETVLEFETLDVGHWCHLTDKGELLVLATEFQAPETDILKLSLPDSEFTEFTPSYIQPLEFKDTGGRSYHYANGNMQRSVFNYQAVSDDVKYEFLKTLSENTTLNQGEYLTDLDFSYDPLHEYLLGSVTISPTNISSVWINDLDEQQWIHVIDIMDSDVGYLQQFEKYIWFWIRVNNNPAKSVFIEKETMQAYLHESPVMYFKSDDEWVSGDIAGVDGDRISLLRLGSWEEYEIDSEWGQVGWSSVYVPPPGGVAEMRAMREAE